jgi:hypothetical protein
MDGIVNAVSILLFFVAPLGLVILVALALASAFAFGGAQRNGLALLTSGFLPH